MVLNHKKKNLVGNELFQQFIGSHTSVHAFNGGNLFKFHNMVSLSEFSEYFEIDEIHLKQAFKFDVALNGRQLKKYQHKMLLIQRKHCIHESWFKRIE